MSSEEDAYLPISGLNDLLFCRRRCYLHRAEEVWIENQHTVAGRVAHRRVDLARTRALNSDEVIATSLRVTSHRLRLTGICDLVEFRGGDGPQPVPFPVEYKLGRRRRWHNDEVQLCAQALCIEEMLGVAVPCGAIYSVKSRRHRPVSFDPSLRALTEASIQDFHDLTRASQAPVAIPHRKCQQCSLIATCLPDVMNPGSRYQHQVNKLFDCTTPN